MSGFAKIDYIDTRTEIHFIPTHESYTQTLSKYFAMDGQICFHTYIDGFLQHCQTMRIHYGPNVTPDGN